MDPLTIGLSLIKFAPDLVKWFTGSDKDAAVATKAVELAQTLTGTSSGEEALAKLELDPADALAYKTAVLNQSLEFDKLVLAAAVAVNTTMQSEAASDHWPTYSWRPFIGFQFGLYVMAQWLLPMFHIESPKIDSELMLAIGGILGVASWFRGKAQATPSIPTDNRG